MINSTDLYLGSFLVMCGFVLCLLNVRRLVKGNASFSTVLISQNILLMCIGVAFVNRSLYDLNPVNVQENDMERTGAIMSSTKQNDMFCDFSSVLMAYGPMIVSLVNSFLSLIIDNYMHYRIIADIKKNDDENTVREIGLQSRDSTGSVFKKFLEFWKKHFSFLAIIAQWVVPLLMALSMYPMGVREKVFTGDKRSTNDSCLAMIEASNSTCGDIGQSTNFSLELRNYKPLPDNYLEAYESFNYDQNTSQQISNILLEVNKVVYGLKNKTTILSNVDTARKPKSNDMCMKVCYLDNKNMILYMLLLTSVCYFVPITISTVILTKIHNVELRNPNVKTYISRELLYNVLFWSPVMFDTFVSLIFCSYTTNGLRTSMFNVIANIYQAVKNFMNTKYFKDNAVLPI